MNYRHAFHAGNFADLVKHAILLGLLDELTAPGAPLTVIETHAGAGVYDLEGGAAQRTGEAEAGVGRLLADSAPPSAFASLRAVIGAANPAGGARIYPGSPLLIAARLRPRDCYIACEIHPEDAGHLRHALAGRPGVTIHAGDGWAEAERLVPAAPAAALLLVDPPYEQGDDGARAARLLARAIARNPRLIFALWLPIKDLAAYDDALCAIEDAAPGRPVLAAEARLRPLSDPMRMNGCAMVIVNPPPGAADRARAVVEWVAARLGEPGAVGRVTLVGG